MNKIYRHYSRIFFDYKITETDFINTHFNNEPWHIKEYWSVFIGFDKHFFKYEYLYYDGHTTQSITILGICFGKSYSYDSKSIKNWELEKTQNNIVVA